MQAAVTGTLIELFARFPRLAGLFGLLIAVAFGFLGVIHWLELQHMPRTPEALTLADAIPRTEAGQEIWVRLEGIEWDCANLVSSGGRSSPRTGIFFTDEAHSVLGLATFSEHLTCEQAMAATPEGILQRMSDGTYERLPRRGFDLAGYESSAARLDLCTFCGRDNSLGLVILAGILVPLGLLMYPMSLYLRKDLAKKGKL